MDEEIGSRFIFFSPWTFLFIFLIIIIGNLFIVDIALWGNAKKQSQKEAVILSTPSKTTTTQENVNACPGACLAEIKKATTTSPVLTPVSQTISADNSVKEFFVPLGSGSSTASDWEDVPGIQGYIDSTAYGKIKNVTFEVSLYTPTANQFAYARLYNVTDKHPVWNSDVTIEGGTPQLKVSSPISLDSGSKLYQVQMKTQLQSRTNLENARVHIVTY